MAEAHHRFAARRARPLPAPHKQADGRAHADALAVVGRREHTGVGQPLRRQFARLAAVAVQTVEPQLVELAQQPLAHDHERRIAQVGEVGDVGDHPLATEHNPLLGDAKEAHVEVVEVELLDPPAPLGDGPVEAGLVWLHQRPLLLRADPGEGVVGRVAQDDQDALPLLDVLGRLALRLQFGEGQPGALGRRRLPAGQRVGQIDPGPLPFVG